MLDAPESPLVTADSEQHLHRFPVILISFTLIWVGVLTPLGNYWLATQTLSFGLITPHNAMLSLLCGGALLTARSRPRISRGLAVIALIASLTMAQEFLAPPGSGWLPSWYEESARIKTKDFLIPAMLAAAIFCSSLGSLGRRVARAVSVLIILFCLHYLFFRLTGATTTTYEHTNNTGNLGALLGILSGCATFAASMHPVAPRIFAYRNLSMISVVGAFVAVFSWYALSGQNNITNYQYSHNVANRIQENLHREVSDQIALIDRMAHRWSILDTIPSETVINEELFSYLDDYEMLEHVFVIDPNKQVRWAPATQNQVPDWLSDYLRDPEVAAWLDNLHLYGQANIRAMEGVTAVSPRSLIAGPITSTAMKGWTILAVQNLEMLVAKVVGPSPGNIQFLITTNGHTLYDVVSNEGQLFRISDSPVLLPGNISWDMSSWYVQRWATTQTLLPDLILLICLAFTDGMIILRKQALQLLNRSEQLRYNALHKLLTGLPNRTHLEIELSETCSAPDNYPIRLISFELDGIKLINDTLGHTVGDQVAQQAARRIANEAGQAHFVAQIESNEFVVLMRNASRGEALNLTNRILAACASPCEFENMELRLTASAGITSRHVFTDTPMDLLGEADLALGFAKRVAPSFWHEYTAELGVEVAERLTLRNELQQALDNNDLDLHYQPLVAGHTGKIVGIEALVRWRHATMGNIPPDKFIPIAESTGQITQLTAWVIDRACQTISDLHQRKLTDCHVAVNISPQVFDRHDFIALITSTLSRHNLPARRLQLEITEGTMLNDQTHTAGRLQTLKELGVHSSIDDFGTGYSSLGYLKALPIDKVKIDKSFAQGMTTASNDAAVIIKTMIDLAHHLQLQVVAEGVETIEQYQFLLENGCDQFQGYLFSRPLPLSELERQLGISNCLLPGQITSTST
ncbi:bifunctional diguanylate cyclase/phosphodiesterase [Pusillimonas sp. MFBS29]|uniref:putative bifunctional diguanylate cyclase/phosphodiesterase n=1 Tax=Pusillimonas sp. MFBS29 TaxID=2886690 RepID=UPI001D0FA151|nr:bifunctional diguanylate cyclase/phosphodiesterase [Pusillimonas sp. MFBS29]MCC2595813.1 bifunctional diguanylate cyclase/phosphodiesterase [Pusillimonas sp. MFBS29]